MLGGVGRVPGNGHPYPIYRIFEVPMNIRIQVDYHAFVDSDGASASVDASRTFAEDDSNVDIAEWLHKQLVAARARVQSAEPFISSPSEEHQSSGEAPV